MTDVQPAYERALRLAEHGRSREALSHVVRALALDPHHLNLLLLGAWAALEIDDPEQAARFAEQAIAVNPDVSVAHARLASARWWLDDRTGAGTAADAALAIDPENVQALVTRARVLAAEQVVLSDHVRARATVARFLELAPDQAWAHAEAARLYGALRRPELRAHHIARGLELDPHHRGLQHMLADEAEAERRATILTGLLAQAPDDRRALGSLLGDTLPVLRLLTTTAGAAAFAACVVVTAREQVVSVATVVVLVVLMVRWTRGCRLPAPAQLRRLARQAGPYAVAPVIVCGALFGGCVVLVVSTIDPTAIGLPTVLAIAGAAIVAGSLLELGLVRAFARNGLLDLLVAGTGVLGRGSPVALLGPLILLGLAFAEWWASPRAAILVVVVGAGFVALLPPSVTTWAVRARRRSALGSP